MVARSSTENVVPMGVSRRPRVVTVKPKPAPSFTAQVNQFAADWAKYVAQNSLVMMGKGLYEAAVDRSGLDTSKGDKMAAPPSAGRLGSGASALAGSRLHPAAAAPAPIADILDPGDVRGYLNRRRKAQGQAGVGDDTDYSQPPVDGKEKAAKEKPETRHDIDVSNAKRTGAPMPEPLETRHDIDVANAKKTGAPMPPEPKAEEKPETRHDIDVENAKKTGAPPPEKPPEPEPAEPEPGAKPEPSKDYKAGAPENAGKMMSYAKDQLVKEGVPEANADAAAALLVGQATMESGLDPKAMHDWSEAQQRYTGKGIYGARNPTPGKGRWANMEKWMAEHGYEKDSAEGQMRYMAHEAMSGGYKRTRDALMAASEGRLDEASRIITKDFEAPLRANDRTSATRQAWRARNEFATGRGAGDAPPLPEQAPEYTGPGSELVEAWQGPVGGANTGPKGAGDAPHVKEDQATAAAIRRGAISPALRGQLEAAGAATGLTARVTSGGQRMKGAPGHTGSHRHDVGGSADLELYEGERKLDMRNPRDAAKMASFVTHSVAAGATGVGAGLSYMGPHTIHVGGGHPTTWGPGKAGPAPWLRGAWSKGREAALSGKKAAPIATAAAKSAPAKSAPASSETPEQIAAHNAKMTKMATPAPASTPKPVKLAIRQAPGHEVWGTGGKGRRGATDTDDDERGEGSAVT